MSQVAEVEILSAPISRGADGILRIAGTRVRLDTVVNAYLLGCSAEEIVGKYPSLSLSDAYSVIAYYLQQRDVVDAYMAERNALIEQSDAELEMQNPRAEIRERLLARRMNVAS